MNLLSKIQKRLHSTPEKPSGETKIESLDELPDHEKVKVLDYLSTVKKLHKDHGK